MNFLDSSANAILPMNTNNAIISKDIIDDHVKKIKEHELSKFEGLCKDFKVYDEKDKKHLKPSFYESMIDKLEQSIFTYISEHQDMPKDMLSKYAITKQKKINQYEYLGKQLQNYKKNVETQIAKIPKNTNQLMEEFKTLVDEIVERIVKETNVRYSYIIKKMLYNKIDRSIEAKVDEKIIESINKIIIDKSLIIETDENEIQNEKSEKCKMPDFFKQIKQHM